MEEIVKKIEKSNSGVETSSIKPKKHKHNSKRRKSKKNSLFLNENSQNSRVDEVVNFLCNSLSKDESEPFVETNSSFKMAKNPYIEVETVCGQNHKRQSKSHLLPSTSSAEISSLFENLNVSTSNKLISPNSMNYFSNDDFLKISNFNFVQNEKKTKMVNKSEELIKQNVKLKEYFNLNLVPQLGSQTNMFSMPLVSEQNLYSKDSSINQNYSKTPLMVSEELSSNYFSNGTLYSSSTNLDSNLIKKETQDKTKKIKKKKNKGHKDTPSSSNNHNENKPLNTLETKDFNEKKSLEETKNKKKQVNSKNSNINSEKFPEYSTEEELQCLSNFGVLMSGIIRINQKNYKEAYITAPDKGMDILIEGLKDRNRALEGDEVYFVLKPKKHYRTTADTIEVQRTAVVVGIKTMNHNRGAIGTLNSIKNKSDNFALFSPRDSKLPRIRIKKSDWPKGFLENSESFKEKLYFARISHWSNLRFAEGEIIKEVGLVGDIEAETDALLLKNDLDTTPYGDEFKQFIPSPQYKIPEEEIQKRLDLRKECIFTIDPATAVDLDDAVSCKRLPNGNYEVGVHISDVTYFLTEGTPLDLAVSKRATTIYLVQKTFHMLPFDLCQVCSLTPGEDKLSFSIIWEISPDSKIISHRFSRSVINSCAQFSYEQVQSIIDSQTPKDMNFPKIYGGRSIYSIIDTIWFLHKTAMHFRRQRFGNGALKIDNYKIYFSLDENHLPVSYNVETHEESHQMIEEFMLLANITVAERLNRDFPDIAFLRCHSPPLSFVLERCQKSLEKYGIILDISSSGTLQASLQKYSGDDAESVARMLVLNNLIAKPMARAKYYCSGIYPDPEDRRHYALNVPLYTHFTSPLRRYADIMTHRLLAAALNYSKVPNWTIDFVQDIASNCNKQKYAAKLAQETSTELFLSLYIGQKGPVICKAVVSDIKDKSFDCICLSTGSHQRLYFEHIEGTVERQKGFGTVRLIIKWPKNENYQTESVQIVEMFSIIKIELKRTNVLKLEARLLRRE